MAVWTGLKKDILTNDLVGKLPADAEKWMSRMLDYTVVGGKVRVCSCPGTLGPRRCGIRSPRAPRAAPPPLTLPFPISPADEPWPRGPPCAPDPQGPGLGQGRTLRQRRGYVRTNPHDPPHTPTPPLPHPNKTHVAVVTAAGSPRTFHGPPSSSSPSVFSATQCPSRLVH